MVPNGNCELDDLHLHTPTVNAQARHCHWQGEPPGTGAARVQEHDTVSAIDSRTVRVAGDDDVKLCCRGVEIELTQIDQPTMIILGEQDHFLTQRARDKPAPERLAEEIPGCRLVRLPAVGRLVPEESPETLINLVLDFDGASATR